MSTLVTLENLWRDLRFAARQLRLNPGFTLVAVLSLALGIGANTAIFQLLNVVRLRSLPIARPHELAQVSIEGGNRGYGVGMGVGTDLTHPQWEQIRAHQDAFSGIFAWGTANFQVGRGAQARRVNSIWVSGDMFSVLGVNPVRGRLFHASDDRRGCGPEGAVISYAFWQREFGGEDSAIGKALVINDKSYPIIGVTPPEFFGLEVGRAFEVALPVCTRDGALDARHHFWLTVMGRLKPGWTLAQAAEQMKGISPGIFEATIPPGYHASNDEVYRKFRLTALPAATGVSRLRENYEQSLWLLLAITGLVLLIACANLANLLLARASAREREIAVRLAIGASRARLIGQLLSESLLLSAAGAVVGAVLAERLSRGLVWFLTTERNPLQLDLSTDWRVLSFMTAVAILTCLLFGLAPAWRSSHTDPGAAMKAGGRGLTTRRGRFSLQRLLVVSQIAVTLVLLVGALLFVRSFRNLTTFDPGFRQDGILAGYVDFSRLNVPKDRLNTFSQDLLERIRSIAQVESVSTATHRPLLGGSWNLGVRVPGAEAEQEGGSRFTWVSPGYFQTLQIPILAGRDFHTRDTATSAKVVVVNETFVRRFLPGTSPLGRLIRSLPEPGYPETVYEVVGVVKDTKYSDLRETIPPITFAPASQDPDPGSAPRVLIRSSAPPSAVATAVRQIVGGISPEITMELRVFRTQVEERLVRERLMAWLSGSFGALAALLAMIGLYGVISYMVVRRRNEIGIRLALGADRGRVVWMILGEAVVLLGIGLVLGAGLAVVASRAAQALLFGLKAGDPLTLASAVGALAAVALAATYLPARRAARLDPMAALREE